MAKPIIDEIDKVSAKHYGFMEEELDSIIRDYAKWYFSEYHRLRIRDRPPRLPTLWPDGRINRNNREKVNGLLIVRFGKYK